MIKIFKHRNFQQLREAVLRRPMKRIWIKSVRGFFIVVALPF